MQLTIFEYCENMLHYLYMYMYVFLVSLLSQLQLDLEAVGLQSFVYLTAKLIKEQFKISYRFIVVF